MSTHAVGFIPPDEAWEKMKAVWEASEKAGIAIPNEVIDFFGGEEPTDAGREVDIKQALVPYEGDGLSGFDVKISLLPPEVTTVRFYNSW